MQQQQGHDELKQRWRRSKSTTNDGTIASAQSHEESANPNNNSSRYPNSRVVQLQQQCPSSSKNDPAQAVWAGRIFFVMVLLCMASLLGLAAHTLLTQHEQQLARAQFQSKAQRALVEAEQVVASRRWGGVTMANFVAELYPDASQWPFCAFEGFERVVRTLLQTSKGQDMGFVPFVQPSQVDDFNVFANQVYEDLGFPPLASNSDDNNTTTNKMRQIWSKNATQAKYNDVTGETFYNSPYAILTPIFRTDEGAHPVLMFNPHSQPLQGQAIDRLITCSIHRRQIHQQMNDGNDNDDDDTSTNDPEHDDDDDVGSRFLQEAQQSTNTTTTTAAAASAGFSELRRRQDMPPNRCAVITDIFPNVKFGGSWSAANFLPIYPVNDPLTVVGYIPSIFVVDELLENVFATEIDGIDAVLESPTKAVSYTIRKGVAHFVGEGKIYDRRYESLAKSIPLLDSSMYTDDSPTNFTFTLTPNADFFKVYETQNPVLATVGAVVAILVTSLVFFLYDFLVRREFHAKQELLAAKRQLLRFVSHECRTPLNAVSMGLDLMSSEIAQALGYESAACLRAHHHQEQQQQQQKKLDHMATAQTASSSSLSSSGSEAIKQYDACQGPKLPDEHNQEVQGAAAMGPCSKCTCIDHETVRNWFQLSQEIHQGAQAAVDVLTSLLDYDKVERDKLELAVDVFSFWKLIETSALEFKLSASSKQVNLGVSFRYTDLNIGANVVTHSRDLPDDIQKLKVMGDAVRLTQVLRNLISNAVKFSSANGSVQVEAIYVEDTQSSEEQDLVLDKGKVVSGSRHGCVKVLFTDTGVGMSEEQLSRLFQDGVQFNPNDLQAGKGSGIGLYISKSFVQQHNGKLSASSPGIGQGATFELLLPLWKLSTAETTTTASSSDDDPEQEKNFDFVECRSIDAPETTEHKSMVQGGQAARAPEPAPASNEPEPLYILVVDDVASNRKLLKRLLERSGHSCDEADNGQKAVEMVVEASQANNPYDSVLLDYEMPICNGPSAAKEIRRLGYDVGIIGITGNVLPEDIRFFRSCGANDVLAKPVKLPDLHLSWMECGIYPSRRTGSSAGDTKAT